MKKCLLFVVILSMLSLVSCEEDTNTSSSILSDTSVVIRVNDPASSEDADVLKIVEVDHNRHLYIRTDTIIYTERESGSGFSPGNANQIHPGDDIEFYFSSDDLSSISNPIEIQVIEIYIYKVTEP